MRIDFFELSNYCFDISNIFSAEQTAAGETTFIMQNSRPTDALLLFINTTGVCYQDNLPPLYIPQGSLVYMPKNSRYIWENSPAHGCDNQRNLLFEFTLTHFETYSGSKNELCRTSESGESISFSDKVEIVTIHHSLLYEKLFMKLIDAFSCSPRMPLSIFCAAYDILNTVSNNSRIERYKYIDIGIIKDSIKYLEDISCNTTINEIAKKCNISLGYYEKIFYGYLGMTPREYKSIQRINHIKMLLQDKNMTLEVIAEKMGYCDSGYLCHIFKKNTGMTPGEYRRLFLS